MADKKLVVIEDPENPVPQEVMAKALVDLSRAAEKILMGPLTERALLVLLNDATGVPMKTIKQVLFGTQSLFTYVKKEHR
jgi:hypothetical protein